MSCLGCKTRESTDDVCFASCGNARASYMVETQLILTYSLINSRILQLIQEYLPFSKQFMTPEILTLLAFFFKYALYSRIEIQMLSVKDNTLS